MANTTTLAPAQCVSNAAISVEGASCQAQLYRHPATGAAIVILCFAAEDLRSLDRLPELAARAARYYRALPLDPATATWLLYLPGRQAPEACGGVFCPETWDRLSLRWTPDGQCRDLRPALARPHLLDREEVETLIGGSL